MTDGQAKRLTLDRLTPHCGNLSWLSLFYDLRITPGMIDAAIRLQAKRKLKR